MIRENTIHALNNCKNIKSISGGLQLSFNCKWVEDEGYLYGFHWSTLFMEMRRIEKAVIDIIDGLYNVDCVSSESGIITVDLKKNS